MQTGWLGWTSTPSTCITIGFRIIQSKLGCVTLNAKCIFNFHILCLVYPVQPLDSNFITCVNIHNYEHFGRKGGYLIACATQILSSSPHNAPCTMYCIHLVHIMKAQKKVNEHPVTAHFWRKPIKVVAATWGSMFSIFVMQPLINIPPTSSHR